MIKADDIITKLESEGWWICDQIKVDTKDLIQAIVDETTKQVKNLDIPLVNVRCIDCSNCDPYETNEFQNIGDEGYYRIDVSSFDSMMDAINSVQDY